MHSGVPRTATPCLLKIMPGVYDVGTNSITMQPYIDIEGSGENSTVIQGGQWQFKRRGPQWSK